MQVQQPPPDAPAPRTIGVVIAANQVLMGVASGAAPELDKVTGWTVGGIAALLALALTNMDKTQGLVCVETFKRSLWYFLALLMIHVIQRILTTIIMGRAGGIKTAAEFLKTSPQHTALMETLTEAEAQLFLSRVESASIPGFRWLAKKQLAEAAKGNLDFSGRSSVKMIQAATYLAVAQAVLAAGTILALINWA